MEEPKHVIEVKEFICPFCDTPSNVQTKDVIVSEEGSAGFTMDGWTCKVCGSDNDIFDEIDFTSLKDFTLEKLSNMNDFGIVEIFQFASHIVQKREFEKAAKIMRHILSQDSEYHECKYLLERVEKVIELKKVTNCDIDIAGVIYAMEDRSGLMFLNTKTGKVLSEFEDEKKIEKISHSGEYLYIDPLDSRESYSKMEEFIEMVDDENLKQKLSIAIQGPGTFRRFKDVLASYSGTTEYRQMWLDFYNSFLWNEAMDFLIASLGMSKKNGSTEFIEVNGLTYPISVEETAGNTI